MAAAVLVMLMMAAAGGDRRASVEGPDGYFGSGNEQADITAAKAATD